MKCKVKLGNLCLVIAGQPGLQDALERISGQYTVPNVFIGKLQGVAGSCKFNLDAIDC